LFWLAWVSTVGLLFWEAVFARLMMAAMSVRFEGGFVTKSTRPFSPKMTVIFRGVPMALLENQQCLARRLQCLHFRVAPVAGIQFREVARAA
jgi:hypothetical protein